jgi:predicted transcriptional regulator
MIQRAKSKPAIQLPTEAELEILTVLWQLGPSTVRDVHTAIGKGTGYTTVLTQMRLMAEKGLLTRSEQYRTHIYAPADSKQQTQCLLAGNLLHRAFDGSAKNLVLGALSSQKVTPRELREIRAMLDEFERGQK